MKTAYAPMSTDIYKDIDPMVQTQFSALFPFFYMIVMLIPFFYLVGKIASEKESKAREGMKMMGLEDGSYYISWFIVFSTIVGGMSLIVTVVLAIGALENVNMVIFFIFVFLYSMTLYGIAFFIVAILPTRRSSVIAAFLFHFITYLFNNFLADPGTSSFSQYAFSIFPNVCMSRCVKLVFFYNFNTSSGLTFENLAIDFQGYSFRNGLIIMAFDVMFWGGIGLYLD